MIRMLGTRRSGRQRRDRQRGQGLVEFALVLPIFLMLMLIALEFGLAFNHKLTVGLASREGARVGSALAAGGVTSCGGGNDPAGVDEQVIAAAQRILKSPGSDVVMSDISQIGIYKATSTGAQSGGSVNVWTYTPGTGPDIDPSAVVDRLDFTESTVGWAACSRNNGTSPDSIGVQVVYTYRLQTALGGIVNFLKPGTQSATIGMTDQTIMALNPTK